MYASRGALSDLDGRDRVVTCLATEYVLPTLRVAESDYNARNI
ncbi:MAG TPA: hypothetical protein VJ183_17635 [Chloroflexia bacterium]|nr:hypothetical protein [Chloroflexia bacterium]